ncbi:MAG: GNAT family N-acetyltransferase [Aureispira sp.]
MQFKSLPLRELKRYVYSDAYTQSDYIAISKQRALSQERNPRARPEDVVLVLVYEADELVAYLGVFADDLYFENRVEHVGWLSCMWVNPKMRGKGIAKRLLQTVFEAWEYKILVTEFTPAAKGLYDRSGHFIDLAKPKGWRGYLRPNLATLLPKKSPRWQKWQPLLKLADGVLSLPNTVRLWLHPTPSIEKQGYSFEYLVELDDEAWTFIQAKQNGELIHRDRAELDWLLSNPWLLQAPLKDRNAQRYHFSSVDTTFYFLAIKVYNATLEVVAVIIMSYRAGSVKLPYVYVQTGMEEIVWQLIDQHLLAMNAETLTVFQPQLISVLPKRKHPFFRLRAFQRHYIIGKVLQEALEATNTVVLQDGDADATFT